MTINCKEFSHLVELIIRDLIAFNVYESMLERITFKQIFFFCFISSITKWSFLVSLLRLCWFLVWFFFRFLSRFWFQLVTSMIWTFTLFINLGRYFPGKAVGFWSNQFLAKVICRYSRFVVDVKWFVSFSRQKKKSYQNCFSCSSFWLPRENGISLQVSKTALQ